MKTFILLSAIPGSGKSTWAEQYRLTYKNVFIVSSDALRKEITGEFKNLDHDKEMWERFNKDILKYKDLRDDVTVIADSTNILNKYRIFYGKLAEGFDKKVLVVIKKKIEQILETNKLRSEDRIIPDEVIERMYDSWEEPNEETLSYFDEYKVIEKWFSSSKVKDEFHYKS